MTAPMTDALARARRIHEDADLVPSARRAQRFEHNIFKELLNVAEAALELRDGGHAVTFTKEGWPLAGNDPKASLIDALATLEARIEEETDE